MSETLLLWEAQGKGVSGDYGVTQVWAPSEEEARKQLHKGNMTEIFQLECCGVSNDPYRFRTNRVAWAGVELLGLIFAASIAVSIISMLVVFLGWWVLWAPAFLLCIWGQCKGAQKPTHKGSYSTYTYKAPFSWYAVMGWGLLLVLFIIVVGGVVIAVALG